MHSHMQGMIAGERQFQGPTNGHAGGDSVRIDDEVWNNAILRPGHVLLGVGDANGALLPMPTGKLVTHLWYSDGPYL